jgi:hypothetical protein
MVRKLTRCTVKERTMIPARRVMEVVKFLKPGEEWRFWIDYNDAFRITLTAEVEHWRIHMDALFSTKDGRYVHSIAKAFSWHELDLSKADTVGTIAFHLVRMERELMGNKI